MKKLFILLAFLCITKSYSQDPQLPDHLWYFHFGEINGEELILLEPEDGCTLEFLEFGNSYLFQVAYYNCETGWSGEVEFHEESNFDLYELFKTPFWCNNFYDTHNSIYFDEDTEFYNPFTYTIETAGSDKMLTIENELGDWAVYGSVPLSVSDFVKQNTVIYPNPTTRFFTVQSTEALQNVWVYDLSGKLVTQLSANSTTLTINSSEWQSGVYFVKTETDNGRVATEKIIKKKHQ